MSLGFTFKYTMGHGGGGAEEEEFTPTGSPVGWWKADAITGLEDGDPVGTWVDSGENGNDLTQSDNAEKPTYKINIKNGLPAILFDVDVMCVTGESVVTDGEDVSWHCVFYTEKHERQTPFGAYYGNWEVMCWAEKTPDWIGCYQDGDIYYIEENWLGSWHVWCGRNYGAHVDVWQDGVQKVDTDTTSIGCENNDIAIGARWCNSAYNDYDGYITECICHSPALSEANVLVDASGLGTKWDITVS